MACVARQYRRAPEEGRARLDSHLRRGEDEIRTRAHRLVCRRVATLGSGCLVFRRRSGHFFSFFFGIAQESQKKSNRKWFSRRGVSA